MTTAHGDPKIVAIIEENITRAANKLGFTWQHFRPAVAEDYDEIFARIAAEHFDAAYITGDPLSTQPQTGKRIVQLALRHLIPSIGEGHGLAKEGLLMTYNQDIAAGVARASSMSTKYCGAPS
jgi:hypothetical protein